MNSVYVMTDKNLNFFKELPSNQSCIDWLDGQPYIQVNGRVCYYNGKSPAHLIHNNVVLDVTSFPSYDSYLHVEKLYSKSYYSKPDLINMVNKANLPVGTRDEMYDAIKITCSKMYQTIS